MEENNSFIPFYRRLNNDINMPTVGLGTYAIKNIREIVYEAIKGGIRHFDTARRYNNEKEIGLGIKQAIDEGLVKREDLFITTKLSPHERSNPEEAIKRQLSDLNLTYVDLYLDHTPFPILEVDGKIVKTPMHVLWQNMESLVKKGLTKSIGVSNYNVQNMMNLLSFCEIKPVVNQVEINPFLIQEKLVEYCQKNGIYVIAFNSLCKGVYIPLSQGERYEVNLLGEKIVTDLASKYGKTPGQIVLNWAVSQGMLVIPSTSSKERIKENLGVLSFKMSDEDIKTLSGLDKNLRFDRTSLYGYTSGVEVFA